MSTEKRYRYLLADKADKCVGACENIEDALEHMRTHAEVVGVWSVEKRCLMARKVDAIELIRRPTPAKGTPMPVPPNRKPEAA